MGPSSSGLGIPLYAPPEHVVPLDAGKGTVLALDWRALRALGMLEAYEAALTPTARPVVLGATAGAWVPVDALHMHYAALDRLELDDARVEGIGRLVGEGVHGAFLATLVRLAGRLGVSPWLALEQCQKLWVRTWRGGAIAVYRAGARAAHVVLEKVPLCASPFFRTSFAGALCAGIAPFGSTPSALEVSGAESGPSSVVYRVTWQGS